MIKGLVEGQGKRETRSLQCLKFSPAGMISLFGFLAKCEHL